jgi:hypothetical protein
MITYTYTTWIQYNNMEKVYLYIYLVSLLVACFQFFIGLFTNHNPTVKDVEIVTLDIIIEI